MTYPQDLPATPTSPKPYRDRRMTPAALRYEGFLLIFIGIIGGALTYGAPAFMIIVSLGIIGAVVWAVGQIRETLEHPHH